MDNKRVIPSLPVPAMGIFHPTTVHRGKIAKPPLHVKVPMECRYYQKRFQELNESFLTLRLSNLCRSMHYYGMPMRFCFVGILTHPVGIQILLRYSQPENSSTLYKCLSKTTVSVPGPLYPGLRSGISQITGPARRSCSVYSKRPDSHRPTSEEQDSAADRWAPAGL